MASRFGWCMTGHHEKCPAVVQRGYTDAEGRPEHPYECSCECHNKDERLVSV